MERNPVLSTGADGRLASPHPKRCSICEQWLAAGLFAGDVCQGCAERYDMCGVYFCLE